MGVCVCVQGSIGLTGVRRVSKDKADTPARRIGGGGGGHYRE